MNVVSFRILSQLQATSGSATVLTVNPMSLASSARLSRAFKSSCQSSSQVTEGVCSETHDEQTEETVECAAQTQQETVQQSRTKGVPLREVVTYCAKHTFKDYLKKANAGDIDAQILVGQMLCSGYGVAKDTQKGREWIRKAEWKRRSLKLSKGIQENKSKDDEYFFI